MCIELTHSVISAAVALASHKDSSISFLLDIDPSSRGCYKVTALKSYKDEKLQSYKVEFAPHKDSRISYLLDGDPSLH